MNAARQTATVGEPARRVRTVLAKGRDPVALLFEQLPRACGSTGADGTLDVEHYVESLSAAVEELDEVDPKLRRLARASLASAFALSDAAAVRNWLVADFGPRRQELTDYPLRQFVDRALSGNAADERWLDGLAGLIAGRRVENWEDGSLDTFSFKAREMAGRLSRWLFLRQRQEARRTEMVSVHLLTTAGDERAVVIEGGSIDPAQVAHVRRALEGVDAPERVLTELLGELMDARGVAVKA